MFCNCDYILFTKLPWPGDSKGTFQPSSQAATLGCFKIAPISNFLTAQQISDRVLAADYEFAIIF